VPGELLFNQLKAVITKDLRLLGGQLVINDEFLRLRRTGASGRVRAGGTGRTPRAR